MFTSRRRSAARNRIRSFVAGLSGVVLAFTGAVAVSAPAAAENLQLLTLTKSVDATGPLEPGETFTYTIFVGCNQADCVDAAITDALPAELAGFGLAGATVSHTGGGTAPAMSWEGLDESTTPATIGAGTTVNVVPQQSTAGGTTGIKVGQGVTITLNLSVPNDLAADTVISMVLENPTIPPLPPTGGQLPWLAGGVALLLLGGGTWLLLLHRRGCGVQASAPWL